MYRPYNLRTIAYDLYRAAGIDLDRCFSTVYYAQHPTRTGLTCRRSDSAGIVVVPHTLHVMDYRSAH